MGYQTDPIRLEQLLDDSGVSFRTNKRSYIFTCPRCSKPGKLMMLKSDGRFVCWVCAEDSGFKGRPEYALTELIGMPIDTIRKYIYGSSFDDISPDAFRLELGDFFAEDEVPSDIKAVLKGLSYPLDFYPLKHQYSRKGREYLLGRGISDEMMERYDLRYCPVERRVIFPMKVGPKLIGWQARAVFATEWLDEEEDVMRSAPKILTTGPRDGVLMFQDNLAGSEHAIVCEGPIDALKCHLVGGAVATMGKVVSRRQLEIIRYSGVKKVYLALDPDAATETMKLASALGDLDVYRLLPAPGFKDLGEMTLEGVKEQFLRAERLLPGQLLLHLGA